jgi:hypothetical protein
MRWFAHLILRRPIGRRCVCTLLLVAYAITAAGVPISVASSPPKSGEIFPCMTSSCGCRTADQCWRSCCCHSLAERLAWAQKRGIDPPAFALLDQARTAGLDPARCCRSASQTANAAGKDHSCCSDKTAQVPPSNNHNNHIVAWRVLACRGQSLHWLAAAPNLINVRPAVSYETLLLGWLGPATSDIAGGEASDPAVPPPELA